MRNHVTFIYPTEFIGAEEEEGILGIHGVRWFIDLLRRVPGLQIDEDLIQEDWGVIIAITRDEKKFSVGVGSFGENEWYVHFHHGLFAIRQRFGKTGKLALRRLTFDFHDVLTHDPAVSQISWYEDSSRGMDLSTATPSP